MSRFLRRLVSAVAMWAIALAVIFTGNEVVFFLLIAVLGLAGACTAVAGRADKRVVALLSVLSASAFLVPVYQLHLRYDIMLRMRLSLSSGAIDS